MAAPPVSLPGESHRGLQSMGSQKGWTRLSRPENQMGRLLELLSLTSRLSTCELEAF